MVKLLNENTERDFLIFELLRYKEENGRIPEARDMLVYNGYPSRYRFIQCFGSWQNAINIVFYNNEPDKFEREFLISELLRCYKDKGRIPKVEDIKAYSGYPNLYRYQKVFGSWQNAIYEVFYNRKDNFDPYFFSPENMNLRKWYIVGYTIADGSVSNNSLKISTNEKDKDNLYSMHQYMNTNNNITKYNLEYSIRKQNLQWVKDLTLYGVVPRKSLISYIPLDYLKTPEEEAAICRGIFDGDGGIYYYRWGKVFYPTFFVCGSEQLCKDYKYLLNKNCNIDCKLYLQGSIFTFYIRGLKKCQKIYDFLYGHDNFYINRKKERFEKLLNRTFIWTEDNY